MKKTIVAAAIAAAVAAPAAFADVSISGQINMEWYKTNSGDLSGQRNSDLSFKASEDLGNGMKAFAQFDMTADSNDNVDASNLVQDAATNKIGLSGDFGTVEMGRMETFIESHVAAMAANDASDLLTNEVSAAHGAHGENTLQYTSPSINGMKVAISAIGDSAGDNLDTTQIGVEYSNGPLLVRAATSDDNGADETVIGASYKVGDLTVAIVNSDNTIEETWFGASYTMGANTIAVSTTNSDTAANEDTIVSLKHALSKNTAVYLVRENDGAANSDTTLVGMQVKF
jgi:predicted porin